MNPIDLPDAVDPPPGGLTDLRRRIDRRRRRIRAGIAIAVVALAIGFGPMGDDPAEANPVPSHPLMRLAGPGTPESARFEGMTATRLRVGEGGTRVYLLLETG